MGLREHPTQRQKRLGRELQRMREPTGLSAAAAGQRIGVGRAHMSHIEAGRTHVSPEKVRALADALGCTRHTLIDELAEMAGATGRGWWTEYKPFLPARMLDLAELESTTTAFRLFEWSYVPGLLQTPDYVRALFNSSNAPHSSDMTDRYLEFRLHRQDIFAREETPSLHAIIHEGAFRVGFVERSILTQQLEYLIEMAKSPNITIQLLPFQTNTHAASPGAFTILDARSPELRTVYTERPAASCYISEQQDVTNFAINFKRLQAASLPPLDPRGRHGEGSLGLAQFLLYSLKGREHVWC